MEEPVWVFFLKKDFSLLQLASEHIAFMRYVSSWGDAALLDIAEGPLPVNTKENRKFFDVINQFRFLMSERAKNIMDYHYREKGYEGDDLPSHTPSYLK